MWQNNLLNFFEDDLLRLQSKKPVSLGSKADSVLREHQSFKYVGSGSKRNLVTWVDWHPTLPGVMAVAYAQGLTFDERVSTSSAVPKSYVGIWSLVDPINPQLLLEAPHDVYTVQFNPKNPSIVAAGCFNGQVR